MKRLASDEPATESKRACLDTRREDRGVKILWTLNALRARFALNGDVIRVIVLTFYEHRPPRPFAFDNVCARGPMARMFKEMVDEYDIRISADAIDALHQVCEKKAIHMFRVANRLTRRDGRTMVQAHDLRDAWSIAGPRPV